MEWEKPEFVEISLACEISSYSNAEFGDYPLEQPGDTCFESGR
jgi:coenzyme PQQ precursor peptide PqqA